MKDAMSNASGLARSHERWARFRFSVIGPLLAAPPDRGELQEQLKSLAAKKWHHPITGQRVQFGLSTIELFRCFLWLVSELANVWDSQVELAGSVVGGGSKVDEVLESPSHSLC